ncbi:MAG: S1 RNA-binding domain-containing protein [Oscillospiraceae bacterium]|nr:S1 RNA-binding domain-containing protein [Oscillospiraceae bacterium]
MQLDIGSIYDGRVTGITSFGAFVELAPGITGMVHISEVSVSYVKEVSDHLEVGQMVKVMILKMDDPKKISLSIKKTDILNTNTSNSENNNGFNKKSFNRNSGRDRKFDSGSNHKKNDPVSFEDMLSKFKQNSDEKLCDLKKFMDNKRSSYSRRGGSR